MTSILVGTCSWTDPALVRSGWYPHGRRDAEGRLRYYAERFAAGIESLRAAGRLGGVLFQFPPWFRPGARAERFLAETAETAERTAAGRSRWSSGTRPGSWWEGPRRDHTGALLGRHGLAAVAVDMVQRFRYGYRRAELAEWVPRLRTLAERVDEVHVLFDNCCGTAAETMSCLLSPRS
ncbi:DUF72 domain-containing protein [Streptomyces sp. SID13726]|uniref:DUF72 domain-containing protein n=1 Tax=Streptomyces sp. SID13726 TaxID=2706058 RepID=UPI0013BA12FD|nr:DUF72 domain-containing protein [Streptomyces sp. SID13726]NEB05979.1 DUF72 domain-containing protein [Streptomyces sp. SID13726]